MQARAWLCSLVLLGLGCGEPNAPSSSGPMFMSAIIDGKRWSSDSASVVFSLLRSSDSVLYVTASHTDPYGDYHDVLEFQVRPVTAPGTHPLSYDRDPLSVGRYAIYSPPTTDSPQLFASVRGSVGWVRIDTVDRESQVITGTFEYDAQQLGGPLVVHARSGEFKVHYLAQ